MYANVPAVDGRMLRVLAETTGAKQVLEIGTSTGLSGLWFLMALRTTGGRLTTLELDPHRAALARAAKLSRFSGLRLYTRTACARRTVSTASSWVHAWVPLPISATVLTSAGASRSVATPVAAPVRIWPRWLASISASGSALAASYSSTWKCIAPRFTLVA